MKTNNVDAKKLEKHPYAVPYTDLYKMHNKNEYKMNKCKKYTGYSEYNEYS